MAQYTRLTTAALNTLNSTTLGNLKPYQIEQVVEYLSRVSCGKANSNAGRGAQSNISNQPTMAQIVTLCGSNNV